MKALTEAVDYVKTDLMPDFDFDAFNHDDVEGEGDEMGIEVNEIRADVRAEAPAPVVADTTPAPAASTEDVDKW